MSRFFAYDFDRRFMPLWIMFGARPSRDGVTITDDEHLEASFGFFFRVRTPLPNIADAHITRDYRWWTAIGVRGSLADDGLTFGTNCRGGVCIYFRDRLPRTAGFHDHSALTVTVADLEGLTEALTSPPGT
jgi:hypothetical protein